MNGQRQEFYVYRYTDKSSKRVVYVGKTNCSLKARVDAHKRETAFAPYKCDIDCVRLSNKVETDSVEKFLINYYKPCINLKDKVPMLTENIELSGLNWTSYEEYMEGLRNGRARVSVLRKESLKQANILGTVVGSTVFSVLLPETVSLLPTFDGYIQFAEKNVTAENIEGRTMFHHKLIPESVFFLEEHYYEVLAAIWRPVVQASDLGEKTLAGFAACEYAFEALDILKDFAHEGYQSLDYFEPFVVVLPAKYRHAVLFIEREIPDLSFNEMNGKLYIEWAHEANDKLCKIREAICKEFVRLVRAEEIWSYEER